MSETRAVLEAHGLTKYSLGQNFLINDAILQKIVALADLAPDDYVLEVGPA
ncbi:MAG: rRNA adenine N-6-methyltransferase family protein [Eggerthella lenta]